jgi:cysteine desulfurase/selenocysteine lyase
MPSELSKEFSLTSKGGYFNCAAQGPLPKFSAAAIRQGIADKENPWMMADRTYGDSRARKCREVLSQLIGMNPRNVALASSTGWGVHVLLHGLDFKEGDEVLAFNGQFPSNIAPWEFLKSKGAKLIRMPSPGHIVDLKVFEKSFTKKTKLVSLEWVHFVSGERIPLKEMIDISHKHGALVIVDITQGLGAIPFSMKEMGADAIACSGYKWLLSPYGTGLFAVTDELLSRLKTPNTNWNWIKGIWNSGLVDYGSEMVDEASRYDIFSNTGFLNLDGMIASVNWLNTQDIQKHFEYTSGLARLIQEGINKNKFTPMNTNPERQSQIASFVPKVDIEKLTQILREKEFVVTLRGGIMRVSPNIYNDEDQVEGFLNTVNDF